MPPSACDEGFSAWWLKVDGVDGGSAGQVDDVGDVGGDGDSDSDGVKLR